MNLAHYISLAIQVLCAGRAAVAAVAAIEACQPCKFLKVLFVLVCVYVVLCLEGRASRQPGTHARLLRSMHQLPPSHNTPANVHLQSHAIDRAKRYDVTKTTKVL